MNRMSAAIVVAVIAIVAAASASAYFLTRDSDENDDSPTVDPEAKKMNLIMTVDGVKVSVDWEDNPSIDAIKTLAKDTLTLIWKDTAVSNRQDRSAGPSPGTIPIWTWDAAT